MSALDVIEGRRPWELILGDNLSPADGLATLPEQSVDHVITDPPYSEHTHAKQRAGASVQRLRPDGGAGRISVERDLGFDHITQDIADGVAFECSRLTRRWFLAFCDVESVVVWMRALGTTPSLEHVRVGAWLKRDAQPQFTGDRPGSGFEAIEIAHRAGRKRWNGGGRHAVWECNIVKADRLHSTQKPLALMESLIRDFTDPGDIVVDPFAGSATTGVACIRRGRRFIGWELKPDNYRAALARLLSAREQPDLLALESFGREAKKKRQQLGLELDEPDEGE